MDWLPACYIRVWEVTVKTGSEFDMASWTRAYKVQLTIRCRLFEEGDVRKKHFPDRQNIPPPLWTTRETCNRRQLTHVVR